MSNPTFWAVITAIIAISLLVLGQWVLALATAVVAAVGYYLARAIEDVLAREMDPGGR